MFLEPEELEKKLKANSYQPTVAISALNGTNCDQLLQQIETSISQLKNSNNEIDDDYWILM